MINTLGLLEVYGFVAGVEAMDAMLKSANVRLLSHSVTPSALVTIVIEGDLAACRAALDAGCAATEYIGGRVICQKVLGRPEKDTERMVLSFCGNDSALHREILQSYSVVSDRATMDSNIASKATEADGEEEILAGIQDDSNNTDDGNDCGDREISQSSELESEVIIQEEFPKVSDDECVLSQEGVEEEIVTREVVEENIANQSTPFTVDEENHSELVIAELEHIAQSSLTEAEKGDDKSDFTTGLENAKSPLIGITTPELIEDELEKEKSTVDKVEREDVNAVTEEATRELSEIMVEEESIWQAVATQEALQAEELQSEGMQDEEVQEEHLVSKSEALQLEELLEEVEFDHEMEEIFKLVLSYLRDKGDKGSNLLEMSNRLGIDLAKLKRVLHRSVRQKLLRKNSNRYFINL